MPDRLILTVRFVHDRYHGTGPWPPDPARLFQALVAGAAVGVSLSTEARDALAWLEMLDPPTITAPRARRARAVKLWVPNNDADAALSSGRSYAEAVATVRAAKTEAPWLFDATEPLLYIWTMPEGDALPVGLEAVVLSLYRLGRGIDAAFAEIALTSWNDAKAILENTQNMVLRPGPGTNYAAPCPGTLNSLEDRHGQFATRFARVGKALAFRQPPKPLLRRIGYNAPPRRRVYHLRPTGLGARNFHPYPLTEASCLADILLDQIADRLKGELPDRTTLIDRHVRGAGADAQDKAERLRLIPLPTIGHTEADPAIRRVLVEVPAGFGVSLEDLDWAATTLRPHDPDTGEVYPFRLVRAEGTDPVAHHYQSRAHVWRTITPMVLPATGTGRKGPQQRTSIEGQAQEVRRALRHADCATSPIEIRSQREPFGKRGARADSFFAPQRMKRSQRAHVELRFEHPIEGPLVLGNGRYRGLGLFEPVRTSPATFLFELCGPEILDPEALAQAARRAMMARVQQHLRDHGTLPAFFTGHGKDGAPLRSGTRSHVGILVDPAQRHLLFAAPQALDHRNSRDDEARNTRILADSLRYFDRLVAGRAGRFDLRRAPEGPLLARARQWESITDWTPNRHGKGNSVDWILTDIWADCGRRGLPRPNSVEVLTLATGKRGAVRARLRLHFSVAVTGPIALGRTAMKGGGSFVGLL